MAAPEDDETKKADPVDPKTNQPASDFMPKGDGEHADAVKVQQDAIRVGSAMGRHNAADDLVAIRERQADRQDAAESAVESTNAANPLPEMQYAMIPPDVYRAREQARVMAQAAALNTNHTRPGGYFIVNGKALNCNGEAIKE
jgi:hypothetical protein